MKKLKVVVVSILLCATLCLSACGKKNKNQTTNQNADKYSITVACQSEESEKDVLEVLVNAFEAKYPKYDITIKTFTGKDFENYMLSNFSQNIENSPHIVWTSDSIHARWHRYFTDLRPFYERDASTDYSLYYETMLDTASLNGEFRPTKNYTGSFRADKKDTADGTEIDLNHSEYGLYYAPRDYNKPAIVCNTALIEELDADYESYMADNLPDDYQSIMDRLNDIVAGNDWDELDDLFNFSQLIAERINYLIEATLESGNMKRNNYWKTKYAIDLKMNWEPTYVTILNALGIKTLFNADGSISIDKESAKLEELHNKLYAVDRICNSDGTDTDFATGFTFLKIVSRPVVLGFMNTFKGTYGKAALQSIQIPVQDIAAGNSGYAINYYYFNKSLTVDGVTKSYHDICWDFIKFIITEDGQEAAGASGSNIPVLKSLRETGAWRNVADLQGMNHEAWIAGGELKQDWYNIYTSNSRSGFRGAFQTFFTNFSKENYQEGSLEALFARVKTDYNALNPTENVRK